MNKLEKFWNGLGRNYIQRLINLTSIIYIIFFGAYLLYILFFKNIN